MTDKELLELAYKAFMNGAILSHDKDMSKRWNPITDDGDALRLAVKLQLELLFTYNTVRAVPHTRGVLHIENKGNDPYAATRRAIVRAAAEIGKTL